MLVMSVLEVAKAMLLVLVWGSACTVAVVFCLQIHSLPSWIEPKIRRLFGGELRDASKKIRREKLLENMYGRACDIWQVTSAKYPEKVCGKEQNSVHYSCANIIDFVSDYKKIDRE